MELPRKRQAEEYCCAGGDKRVKEEQPSLPPQHQDMYPSTLDIYDEPPMPMPMPLGLRLRKSPSLLNLVHMALSRPKYATQNNTPDSPPKSAQAFQIGERLKASNFPATFLKIGAWEYTSEYEGDLVVKCYYGKRKLVWEVLDNGLKHKIEIQWAHIIAVKATCPQEGDGTLDLVLAQPPLFFKEIGPQPRKHTLWQATSDFTGGQASLYMRQILQCPSTLLRKNFEKLIRCDQRLNQLSQQTSGILDSLVSEPTSPIYENQNESDAPSPKVTPHPVSPCDVPKDEVDNLILQQPEVFAQQVNFGNCMTEQGIAAPSKEVLDIAQCLLSDTHDPPALDEKYLMARVDSLCNLLEIDTVAAASTSSMSDEHKEDGSIFVGQVDSDDFDADLAEILF